MVQINAGKSFSYYFTKLTGVGTKFMDVECSCVIRVASPVMNSEFITPVTCEMVVV